MRTANDLLRTALAYAERGWPVFPVHSPAPPGCSCGRPDCNRIGKHPRTVKGLKDASRDIGMIREWWSRWPDANIGIATGPGSGIFVLDLDGEKGRASLAALETQHGPLPATLTSITGRADGGEHRWFNYPAEHEIRNSSGRLGVGLDVRGTGGYVIVPPSVHESGRAYQWADSQHTIADAPEWFLEWLAEAAHRERSLLPNHVGVLYEGERNDGLFRFACALRRKGLTPEKIASEVNAANLKRCKPSPLPSEEIQTIVSNATKYPAGGPDPLETAWKAIPADVPLGYARFIALARQLQLARPEHPIALPVERIGKLMQRDWTQIRRWRKRAVGEKWLQLKERALWPHHRAALYTFTDVPLTHQGCVPLAEDNCPTSTESGVPLSLSCPTGLMGQSNANGTQASPMIGGNGLLEIVF